jgi:NAD(P)-dependent dehydrogenase (short-subunit alcohol dehydrogenase family)/CMP-N-acetylneuraminic acid synthetase
MSNFDFSEENTSTPPVWEETEKNEVIAIVPVKKHSERVPGKNFRLINGVPLFRIVLERLSGVKKVKRIIVNTDSDTIGKNTGDLPKVFVYKRPEKLCGDNVSVNMLIEDTIRSLQLENGIILQTHVTNPLLKKETIEKAINVFMGDHQESEECKYDSLFSVVPRQSRFYDTKKKEINHNKEKLLPTQEIDPLYEENSCLYLFRRETFLRNKNRIGSHPFMFEMSRTESQDIDWEEDFLMAELLLEKEENKKKVVVVTGSSGGIGREICKLFHKKGWVVIGIDREEDENDFHCTETIQSDVNDTSLIECLRDVLSRYGGSLDCLVNNAAEQYCKSMEETDKTTMEITMKTNLMTPFFLTRDLVPYLEKKRGSVVNISSIHALVSSKGIAPYAISKAALVGCTRTTAIELSPYKIRANCILPGAVNTSMLTKHLSNEKIMQLKESHLLTKRIGEPEEIAECVYFLGNNKKSSFINGQTLVVDGGASIVLSTEVNSF